MVKIAKWNLVLLQDNAVTVLLLQRNITVYLASKLTVTFVMMHQVSFAICNNRMNFKHM